MTLSRVSKVVNSNPRLLIRFSDFCNNNKNYSFSHYVTKNSQPNISMKNVVTPLVWPQNPPGKPPKSDQVHSLRVDCFIKTPMFPPLVDFLSRY